MTPILPILAQFFQGYPHLAYYWLAGLYFGLSIWQTFLFIEILLQLYFPSFNNLWTLPLFSKPQEKIKFWFIQESWIYILVKSRNSQIFYITNIMTFSKFAQEIYFYLLVASLSLIRSKSDIFIHSDFKSSSLEGNITNFAFLNLTSSFGESSPMLKSCWIHSKNNNFLT